MLEIVSCHSTLDSTCEDVFTITTTTTTTITITKTNTRWSLRRRNKQQGCHVLFCLHTLSTIVVVLIVFGIVIVDIRKVRILSDAYSTNKLSFTTRHKICRNNIVRYQKKKNFVISSKKNQCRYNRHLYSIQPLYYTINDNNDNIDRNQVLDDNDTAFLSTTKIVIESQQQQRSTPSKVINFVRWNTNTTSNKLEIQTAVLSLIHPITNTIIELHSQIHYGEEEYYQYYNYHHHNCRSNNNCHSNNNNLYSDNNSKDFDVAVLYELLIDDTLVSVNNDGQRQIRKYQQTQQRLLSSTQYDTTTTNRNTEQRVLIQASRNDQQIANQYGLVCQVDGINYYDNSILGSTSNGGSSSNDNKHIKWIHADWTRQELALYRQQIQQQTATATLTSSSSSSSSLMSIFSEWIIQQQKQLQSLIPFTDTANEATAALLLGPPIVMIQQQDQKEKQQQQQQQRRQRSERRLFTNMFVSGDTFAIVLRWILWLTIPCPELSILVFDSSSIWLEPSSRYESSSVATSYSSSQSTGRTLSATLSPIVLPAIQAFAQGNIINVRKLLFGQIIVAANAVVRTTSNKDTNSNSNDPNGYDDIGDNNSYNEWDIIVTQRNQKCLQVLSNEISKNNVQLTKKRKYIILYGSIHCPDLYNRLLSNGYVTTNVRWRTAWSVPVYLRASTPVSNSSNSIRSSQSDTKNIVTNTTNSTTTTIVPLLVGTVLLVLYLGIGAIDWIGIIYNVVIDAEAGTITNVVTDVVLYLLRHTLLYVVLSRYLLDWKKVLST